MTQLIERTHFLPAERAPLVLVRQQSRQITSHPLLTSALNALPEVLFILNPERQIIFANSAAIALLSSDGMRDLIGLRPGEALDCVRSFDPPAGCGTTAACRSCGISKTFMAFKQGRYEPQECRILKKRTGEALDFRIFAKRLRLRGGSYAIYALTDISDRKRREALEKIFFHDISNSVMALCGRARLLREAGPGDPVAAAREVSGVLRGAESLLEEIRAQKDLAAAERGELAVRKDLLRSRAVLEELALAHAGLEAARQKPIHIARQAEDFSFSADRALLGRIIGNMFTNALEASRPGQPVTAGCRSSDGRAEFWVHNHGAMAEDVQAQVFQRSFSTKGPGRGLGTYGMKLLAERYLYGGVSFESSVAKGTVFRLSLPKGA